MGWMDSTEYVPMHLGCSSSGVGAARVAETRARTRAERGSFMVQSTSSRYGGRVSVVFVRLVLGVRGAGFDEEKRERKKMI